MKNCYNCRFFVSFTPSESRMINKKLSENGLLGKFMGGCVSNRDHLPFIVRRYLTKPVNYCAYHSDGQFTENTMITCPKCKKGDVYIIHTSFIKMKCSEYPACRFETSVLILKHRCRFCQVPLILRSGDGLYCCCPKCKRKAFIPLTIKGWPSLFQIGDKCPHNKNWTECETCQYCIKNRKNIIEYELPEVASYWRYLYEPYNELDYLDDYDVRGDFDDYESIYYEDEYEDAYKDVIEEIYEWYDEFTENIGNDLESGWFYGE